MKLCFPVDLILPAEPEGDDGRAVAWPSWVLLSDDEPEVLAVGPLGSLSAGCRAGIFSTTLLHPSPSSSRWNEPSIYPISPLFDGRGPACGLTSSAAAFSEASSSTTCACVNVIGVIGVSGIIDNSTPGEVDSETRVELIKNKRLKRGREGN